MRSLVMFFFLFATGVQLIAETTFSGRFVVLPNWTHSKTTGSSTLTESFSDLLSWTHTTGTNANQMSTIVVSSGTLTNSQAVTLDLTSSVNGFGDSVAFSTVRFLAAKASSSNVDAIEIGGTNANRFASWTGSTNGVVSVRPGGIMLLVAPDATGYTVGTNGNLVVENTGTNSASYEVYIGGSE